MRKVTCNIILLVFFVLFIENHVCEMTAASKQESGKGTGSPSTEVSLKSTGSSTTKTTTHKSIDTTNIISGAGDGTESPSTEVPLLSGCSSATKKTTHESIDTTNIVSASTTLEQETVQPTTIPRPRDPECLDKDQRVLKYTANEITIDLTGIETDSRTTHYCINFIPASRLGENITCTPNTSKSATVNDLEPGISYTFTIYASVEPEKGSMIQSLNGCANFAHFTRPRDPECPNIGVLDYTANEITIDLTGIKTDSKTTHYCINFMPASKLRTNITCSPKTSKSATVKELEPGISYTFTIYASIKPEEGSGIQSLNGCAKFSHFTRPRDPGCLEKDQRVLNYTANEITLNLTGIETGSKTTHYCINFMPASTSDQNSTCVSKNFTKATMNNLQPGTSYTFTIYTSIELEEGSRIQSLNGCKDIIHFTNPIINCLTIKPKVGSRLFFEENKMKSYNISINSTSFKIFEYEDGGMYDLSSQLDSGMNYTLSITGKGDGGLWTQVPCKINISTGIPKPECSSNFYEVFDTSVRIYPIYCNATGVHVFTFYVGGFSEDNVLPNSTVQGFPTNPGEKIKITVYAYGRNGVPSEPFETHVYTKPGPPTYKKIDYESTNSVINISGSSFSAKGATYFTVELLKRPNVISVVYKTNTSTFEGLQAGQSYTFIVRAKSQHGELSYRNCSFVAFTRPNNPDCDRVSFPEVKTNTITLDLVSLNASGANSYLVTYNSSTTITKNITFANDSLRQEIKYLFPGTNYQIKIFSIGSGGFFSSESCTLEKYTHPPAFQNTTFEEEVSYIRIQWDPEEGNVDRYKIDVNCSCELGSCTECVPNFENVTKESEVNITELNPGSHCNVSLVAISGPFQSAPLILRLKTKELAPGKVSGLNVTAVTTDSITLDWKEPDCPNGYITKYTLSITTAEDRTGNITHTSEYSYRFTKLKPGTFYNISVLAINSVYKGEVSFLHVYTVETVPSQVRNLLAKNTSSTSIKIDWIIPNPPNGVVDKYKVFIITNSTCIQSIQLTCQKCGKMYQDEAAYLKEEAKNNPGDVFELAKSCIIPVQDSFESSNISVSVDNLTFFTEYQVFVYAHTSKGYGPDSNVTVVTSEDRPSRPKHLHGNASQHIIFLEFQTPKPPNGHLIFLQIEYTYKTQNICLSNELQFEKKWEKKAIHGPVTDVFSTKLENLFSHWDYTIRVQMATYVGFGYYSEEVTIRTKPDVPDIVRKIENGAVSSRSIKLLWEGPCQPNGIIEHFLITIYDVTYSKNHSITTLTNNTSYNVTGLFPYRKYVFGIATKTEGVKTLGQKVESRVINTSTEAAYKPRDLSSHTTPVSVLLNWKPPSLQTGPTNYMAVASDLRTGKNISSCLSTGFLNTSCAIKDLHPFWNYRVTLSAKTEPFDANSTSILIRTNESAPGKIADFKVTQIQNLTIPREVILRWTQPLLMDRNGIIQKYFIKYWVADSNAQNTVTTKFYGNETFSANIKDVKPEKEYTFQIFPATIANASEEHYVTRNITITAGAPIPIEIPKSEEYISLGPSSKISDDEKQLSVALNYRSLCDNANGNPVSWFIIVSGESNVPKSLSSPFQDSKEKYEMFVKKEYKTWSSVHTQDQFDPYIARSDWDPECSKHRRYKRALEEKTVSFLVGEEGICDGITGYCNGYLKPGRKYRVRFTVCTREGCLESEFSSPLETKPNLVPAIAGSITGVVVALVVLIVVVALYLKRKGKGPFKDKSSEIERGNDNETFSTELETKKMSKPRPVKTADFAGHVQRMHADSNLLFSNEYKMLKETCPTHTTKAAEIQVNRIKNRYTNILSYDHSRVKLLPTEDDEGSDYINANYIPGYSSQREYIATQGPLPFTRDDFWRMMWEQNVSIIVMLTQLVERGRRKCDIYWPEATREPVYYGDLVVEIESESTLPDYVLRVMSVKLGSRTRKIKQLHYLKWPDMGCPETTWLLLNFVGATRLYLPHNDPGPIVVHCSAGVGRTGTFIAVDFLMQHVSSSDVIDIYDYVMKMRNNRPNMVQTEDQYVFIHDCIRDFINRSDEDSDDENGEGQGDQENPIYANM